ncbi:hypothetical protein IU450_00725 [Nocardia abscessus]|uniref:hypothetical protein n=1 Tax=Nocardia abscessus TaxID=120957 RepID=UPI0018955B25|nr:hypothetical protein [Nocardia abscessus]MBF6334401.1 hypothetical protein [Nocardia abscessus]
MDWIKIGAFATGVLSLLATIYFYYRVNHRRRILLYRFSWERIDATLTYREGHEKIRSGKPWTESPCLVHVSLVNRGPKDIKAADFDDGKPLRVEFGMPILHLLSVHPAQIVDGRSEGSGLDIGPRRLERGQRYAFTVMIDGTPRKSVEAEIVDTDLINEDDLYGDEDLGKLFTSIAVGFFGAVVLLSALVFFAL